MPFRFLLLVGLTVSVLACFDRITATKCKPVTFQITSTNVDTVTTNTGLRYVDGASGSGLAVGWCQILAVKYDAYLLDGTKFDSSQVDVPLVFTPGLGALIDGMEQGVIGMRTGGTRRLIISPALGFGSAARRDASGVVIVPGNSTVIYVVEILQVGNPAQ